jgi:hypothetical protein
MKESLAVRAELADLGVHRIACVTSAQGCYGGDREAGAGSHGAGRGAAGEAGDRGTSPVRPGGAAGRDGDLVPPGLAVRGVSAGS